MVLPALGVCGFDDAFHLAAPRLGIKFSLSTLENHLAEHCFVVRSADGLRRAKEKSTKGASPLGTPQKDITM